MKFSTARTLMRVPLCGPIMNAGSSPEVIQPRTTEFLTFKARATSETVMARRAFMAP
jgi:hypothetical protein